MSASVIVMGSDSQKLLQPAVIQAASTVGTVINSCANGCVITRRVTFDAAASTQDKFALLNYAETKPAEAHVFNFPDFATAGAWFNQYANVLEGKTVFVIDPAFAP